MYAQNKERGRPTIMERHNLRTPVAHLIIVSQVAFQRLRFMKTLHRPTYELYDTIMVIVYDTIMVSAVTL